MMTLCAVGTMCNDDTFAVRTMCNDDTLSTHRKDNRLYGQMLKKGGKFSLPIETLMAHVGRHSKEPFYETSTH